MPLMSILSDLIRMTWFSSSLVVFTLLAIQDLVIRSLIHFGFTAIDFVVYGFVPVLLISVLYIYSKKIHLTPLDWKSAGLFILVGLLTFYGFLYLRQAQILSPNIGYVNSIAYSSVLLTILLTALIFKDDLHFSAFIGAFFIVVGIYLISQN